MFGAIQQNNYFCNHVTKTKLTELRKYKHLVAVVLLAVYAFIATPVQLWHHHTYPAKNIAASPSFDKEKITEAGNNSTIEGNCQLCSHHYSIYSNEAVPAFEIFISFINSKDGFYALAILLAPYFNSTNKGPPAVA